MATEVFDESRLLQFTGEDPELADQVVGVFLSDTPGLLEALEAALAAEDATSARRAAHSVKGSAATVGGEDLRECALACEMLAREGHLSQLAEVLPELHRRFSLLGEALVAHGYGASR